MDVSLGSGPGVLPSVAGKPTVFEHADRIGQSAGIGELDKRLRNVLEMHVELPQQQLAAVKIYLQERLFPASARND